MATSMRPASSSSPAQPPSRNQESDLPSRLHARDTYAYLCQAAKRQRRFHAAQVPSRAHTSVRAAPRISLANILRYHVLLAGMGQ
nr:hypothetical protein B0A51_05481 [Rachicladosporium sp. CCFEE 5018]